MNELSTPAPSTEQLVQQGTDLYATAEQALLDAQEALLKLRKVYPQAYANGDLKGGETIKAGASVVSLAGDIAAIRADLIALHERDAAFAQTAGKDVATPYKELPPVTVIHPDSGGR